MKDFTDFRKITWFIIFFSSSFIGLTVLFFKMPFEAEILALIGSGLLLILSGRELIKLKIFWLSLGAILICILFTTEVMYLSFLVAIGLVVSLKKINAEVEVILSEKEIKFSK